MRLHDNIYIAGHKGMVGSAIVRALQKRGFTNLIIATRQELDLLDTAGVDGFFQVKRPDYVFLAAAKVGGIKANLTYPVEFLMENLIIQNNIISCCHKYQVKKLIFLGSSCIYPARCPQPMKEEYLLTGPLEPTNEGYALAKIAGLRLAHYYHKEYGLDCLCPMPCNLYGHNDNFDPDNSHVLSALVKKFVDAVDNNEKNVILWGTGDARREFLHVDDLAEALLFLVDHWHQPEIINVGSGSDISIKELAELMARKTGYTGSISWDTSMPDGMMRKCLDISLLQTLGYQSQIPLEVGIVQVIKEYKALNNK